MERHGKAGMIVVESADCDLNHKSSHWTANQSIRMISEESCDTEDWSNDAENQLWSQE